MMRRVSLLRENGEMRTAKDGAKSKVTTLKM